ncbi:L-histidine N(alpha)-methyltransferase [Dermatophilaceae bacterium Soc4.6]
MSNVNVFAPSGSAGDLDGTSDAELELAVHLDPDELSQQMAVDVRAGLQRTPKVLPPKYFYDGRGSELFDEITRLEEYYPTRAERAILVERAGEVATITRAQCLVELGSGTSEKTQLLLRALREAGTLTRFVPFDVDPVVLREAAPVIAAQFPGLEVAPEVGDFERHLGDVPRRPRQLVAFLGSTIGNLDPAARATFLADVRDLLGDDGHLLLGTDLVKPVDRLVAAYDDARGVTAAFNRNVLRVINRSLGADFDAQAFAHRAVWDIEHEWIEMRLESVRDQRVHVRDLDLEVSFARGEAMRTEISTKFRREGVRAELATAGLELSHWWTDPAGDFALSLSRPA